MERPKRHAVVEIQKADEVVQSDGEKYLDLSYSIQATDEEIGEIAEGILNEKIESRGYDLIEPRDGGSGKQVGFSSKNWKSSWEPKGPKPPWSQNPGNN